MYSSTRHHAPNSNSNDSKIKDTANDTLCNGFHVLFLFGVVSGIGPMDVLEQTCGDTHARGYTVLGTINRLGNSS